MRARPNSLSAAKHFLRNVLAVVTALVCAAALAVAPASADVDSGRPDRIPKLKGTVGPGFTITINTQAVPSGKYKLIVKDLGAIHNFHITGAGVDKATSIPGTGKTAFKITLTPGIYNVQCDAHSSQMFTSLEVF